MIVSVILDVDGTLVDSVDLHAKAWQEAFEHFGVPMEFSVAKSQIGKGGDEILKDFLSEEQRAEFGDDMEKWRGGHFKKNYLHKVKPLPGAHALLTRLKEAGKKIAIGSSAHQDELDVYLNLVEAKALIDVQTCADDADKSKPHPDIFEVVLKKLDAKPQETIVIGDSPYDAIAADRASIKTIGFLSGGFDKAWLERSGAIEIYSGPDELCAKFNGSILSKQG